MSHAPWVLLRGLMRDSRHWGDFPQAFRAALPEAPVILLDLPGNGSRYRERSPDRVEAMAGWCRAELLRLGIAPPYRLFAMSLGAMVAVHWASSQPQELEACVLANTSLRGYSPFYRRLRPTAWPLLLRMALGNPGPRTCEEAILRLTSNHPAQTRSVLDDWTAWRIARPVSRANALRQLAAAIRLQPPQTSPAVPLLLLTGAGDHLVSSRCSQVLARAWDVPVAVHPSAGHDLPLDDASWVLSQLRRWNDARLSAGA